MEPLKRAQYRDKPFVLSKEVILFQSFLLLSLEMKYSSSLDTYHIIKENTISLSHEFVELCSFVRGYHAYCTRMVSCYVVLNITEERV